MTPNRSRLEPAKDKSVDIFYELLRLYRPIVPQLCLGESLVYPPAEHPLKRLDNRYGCGGGNVVVVEVVVEVWWGW